MIESLYASVKALDDEGPGSFEAVLSTKSLDRDGEVVDPDAFDPLPASIPVYFEHDWKSGAAPVGRGTPFRDGDEIKIKAVYASTPEGQKMRTLVSERIVDSMSVGFLNGKREVKSGVKTVVSGEMFEGSLTAIPVNTGARVLVSKALADEKAGARNSSADQAHIQAAHDHMAALGADCVAAKHIDGKAVEGSLEQRQEELYEVLAAAYPDSDWVERIATFDDHVVYEIHGGTDDDKQFSRPYTFDGNDVTLGDPEPVEAVEALTVTPLSSNAADAAAKAAAPAADEGQAKAIAASRLHLMATPA